MSTKICETTSHISSDFLYSSLRRVYHEISNGGVIHEHDFVSTCRYVSTLLEHTKFQGLLEAVEELFVDVVEMAVILFISRVFPAVRLSILSLANYVPESCEAISSLFDQLDVKVSKCCGYGLQLRIAAINQLLQSDESISATFPKTLNLFLFAEKCRSMSFTTCPDIYSSQHSWQLLNSQPSDQDKYVSSAQIYSTSLPSVEQMHSPSPESPSPNWLTLRNSFGLNLLLPPNFKVVSDQSTRAAAERELSLCAKLLFDLNMQASMQLSQLQNSVNANQSMTENAPSVVSQTFSVDIQSLSPTNTERPSNDSSLGPPVPVISDTASRSPSRKTLAEIKSLNHLVSSPSLQFHDHSRQSSIDLALVSSELLEPDVVQNHADLSLRPLFRISSAESNVPLNLVGEATTLKLNKAKLSPVEVEDLFGCVASSSSEASQEGDDHLLVTGDFPAANTDEMIQPCPAGDTVGTIFLDSSLNEKMSTAAPNIDTGNAAVLGANLVEVNTPVKQTRKRQPSAGGKERSRKGRNSNVIVVDTETVPPESEDALPRYGGDHLRRSKRQRTITAQKQGLDSLGLAVPGEAGMSPRRRTVSKLDKENTR